MSEFICSRIAALPCSRECIQPVHQTSYQDDLRDHLNPANEGHLKTGQR